MTLRILIVGAGIGGPAAAVALALKGHSVTIYERAKTTTEIGYAFRITPNSDRCLQHLGVDTVAGGAVAASAGRFLDSKGNILVEIKENTGEQKKEAGRSVFAFRPQLARQLFDAAIANGVDVKTGVKVKSVNTQETSIELEDGTVIAADLIIGADGVQSAIRPHIIDDISCRPRSSTGHSAIRFMLSRAAVQADPGLANLIKDPYRIISWGDDTKRILVYPVDFDRQYSLTCTIPDAQILQYKSQNTSDANLSAAYDHKISVQAIQDIFAGFEPRARRVFELADPDGFRIWKLQDVEDLKTWSKNRTVIIGDAAHLCLPFAFSGASMAIEDAVMLGEFLPADVNVEDVPSRLQLLEKSRKPRVRRVRNTGREIANGRDRDREYAQNYRQFLMDYDLFEEAKTALAAQS